MGKLTKDLKLFAINSLINDVVGGNTNLYVFASTATPFNDDNNPPEIANSFYVTQQQPLRELMFGKKVISNTIYTDINLMIKRHDWVSNTVYTQYDNTDVTLFDSNFYVLVNDNGNYKVYKCLYNNKNAPSLYMPTRTDLDIFELADGYVWKYMYNISEQQYKKFSINDYIPVYTNTAVSFAASDGIHITEVISGGSEYIAIANGTVVGKANSSLIELDNKVQPVSGFYNNCAVYFDSGTSGAFYTTIEQYISNGSGNWVYTSDVVPSNIIPQRSTYNIVPKIQITGDGSGAVALATVDYDTFQITGATMLNYGSGYTHADTKVISNTGNGSFLVSYIAPSGGHGKNPAEELGCETFGVSITFANTDSLPQNQDYPLTYRTIGLMQDPQAAKDKFSANLTGSVSVSTTSNQISGSSTTFTTDFVVDDYIAVADTADYFEYKKITSIQNNTSMNVESSFSFTNASASYALTLARQYQPYSYENFTQVLTANLESTTVFDVGDTVYNPTTGKSSVVVYANTSTIVLVGDQSHTNESALVSSNNAITNNVIKAVISRGDVLTKYYGNTTSSSLVPKILYINNIRAVTRSNTTNETIKFAVKL